MTRDDPTRRVEVGLRRDPGLAPEAPLPADDPDLRRRIEAEIRAGGPMTFARFMALALYDADAGYYAGDDVAGPGRAGDFLTAPESHPIFGWAIARHLEAVWDALERPGRFVVREHGAGTGALAAGILDGLRRAGSGLAEAIRYQPVDVSPRRIERLRSRLVELDLADALEPAGTALETGVVVANELLDALPVHQVAGAADGGLVERFVGLDADGSLGWVDGPPSTPALADRLAAEGVALPPGQVGEVALGVDAWVAERAAGLGRGELLLIDYGYPAAVLYAPGRGSTLRAYHRHRVHADPFVAIGRQDLTAHVDLTAVELAAAAGGLAPLGRTTQAAFLADLEVGELLVGLQSDRSTTLESYLAAKSAVVRLLDPRATGAFAVLGFGRGLDADGLLPGFRRPIEPEPRSRGHPR